MQSIENATTDYTMEFKAFLKKSFFFSVANMLLSMIMSTCRLWLVYFFTGDAADYYWSGRFFMFILFVGISFVFSFSFVAGLKKAFAMVKNISLISIIKKEIKSHPNAVVVYYEADVDSIKHLSIKYILKVPINE